MLIETLLKTLDDAAHNILTRILKTSKINTDESLLKYFGDIYHKYYTECNTRSGSSEWVKCAAACKEESGTFVNIEIASTAYILRCIANSILDAADEAQPTAKQLHVVINAGRTLTGIWNKDSNYITISQYGTILPIMGKKVPDGKLIMGFGPSASGKTHWAKNIVKLMGDITKRSYPQTFFAIDGGVYRESSVIYSMIKNIALSQNCAGVKNLVTAGATALIDSPIFDSNIIKDCILKYFAIARQHLQINLYVPETLGGCLMLRISPVKQCIDIVNKYAQIASDSNRLYLMIWQHKIAKECDISGGEIYKCSGCLESGQKREKIEGKKYSSSAWLNSISNGMQMLQNADTNTYAISIHNTGRGDGSVSILTSNIKDDEISAQINTYQRKYNYEYRDDLSITTK